MRRFGSFWASISWVALRLAPEAKWCWFGAPKSHGSSSHGPLPMRPDRFFHIAGLGLAHPCASGGVNGIDFKGRQHAVKYGHFINLTAEIVAGRLGRRPITEIVFTNSPIAVVILGSGPSRIISHQNTIHIKAQPRALGQTPYRQVPVVVVVSPIGIDLDGSWVPKSKMQRPGIIHVNVSVIHAAG